MFFGKALFLFQGHRLEVAKRNLENFVTTLKKKFGYILMMAVVVEAAEEVLNFEVDSSLQLQVGFDQLSVVAQEPEKADVKQRRVVELLQLVVDQHLVHFRHDPWQVRRRGLAHGQAEERPRLVLVDKTGQPAFPGNPELRKVREPFPEVRNAVLDPVVLKSHDLAEADVRPRNDFGIDPEFPERVGENFL